MHHDVRLHHTNADTAERQDADLKQAAVVLTSFVYRHDQCDAGAASAAGNRLSPALEAQQTASIPP